MIGEMEGADLQTSADASITREVLYELVWLKPMVEVAKQFDISSSYMARVCAVLNVPRPPRGYWAKLAVGKAPPKPAFPELRPGDEVSWTPGEALPEPPKLVRSGKTSSDIQFGKAGASRSQDIPHRLLAGAKPVFEVGRFASDTGHLRPNKHLLPDLVVSKDSLDGAIKLASKLFLSLEEQGYRVVFAPGQERFRRADVDVHEKPKKHLSHDRLWCPSRPTVVYIGAVAIGLTAFEMTEEVEARYVDGKYIRLSDYVPAKRSRRSTTYEGWTTTRDFLTGRFCIQAYSPYGGTTWVQQWRESVGESLWDQIPAIVKALKGIAPEIGRQAVEARRAAELQHQRWMEQQKQWEREREERRVALTISDSRDELKKIITLWGESKQLEAFFKDAEERLASMAPADRDQWKQRLDRARQLMGSVDALERLEIWRMPEER